MTTEQVSLRIYGVEADCDCDSLMGRAVRELRGVTGVEFDNTRHALVVEFDSTMTSVDRIVHLVERFGFRVSRRAVAAGAA